MIREILQPNTQGLRESDNYEGFRYTDTTYQFDEHNHNGYQPHANHFVSFFKETDKVLELGCGAGNLQYWVKHKLPNITYVTLDINEATKTSPYITPETHFTAYTNQPYQFVDDNNNPIKFDYIISFEHFEHISGDTLNVFLYNIKKHCHQNTKVIATASLQQFGGPHLSVLSKEKWVELIESMGFEMIDEIHLTPENCPPNFGFSQTTDLCFKLK